MPTITQRSTGTPLLNIRRIGHGTLGVYDLAATRRWYEDVLGFDVVQTSPRSLMIRKGTDQCYAVVEDSAPRDGMSALNHNGLEMESREAVEEAFALFEARKEEFKIGRLSPVAVRHGDYSFFISDLDDNVWEFLYVEDGYKQDFADPARDMTGLESLAILKGTHGHTHDPELRERIRKVLEAADSPAE